MLSNRNVEVARLVDLHQLAWPSPKQRSADSSLGGNSEYLDLSGRGWNEAKRLIRYETSLLNEFAGLESPALSLKSTGRADKISEQLHGLDLGIASTVFALFAAGSIPFSSCNGGVLGDYHSEQYPLVAFYAREPAVPLLLAAAEQVSAGLGNTDAGALVVYSGDLITMVRFARSLVKSSPSFRKLRIGGVPRPKRVPDPYQLFFGL
jgi:hypothetical protein